MLIFCGLYFLLSVLSTTRHLSLEPKQFVYLGKVLLYVSAQNLVYMYLNAYLTNIATIKA